MTGHKSIKDLSTRNFVCMKLLDAFYHHGAKGANQKQYSFCVCLHLNPRFDIILNDLATKLVYSCIEYRTESRGKLSDVGDPLQHGLHFEKFFELESLF